jgi:hypothetical protein
VSVTSLRTPLLLIALLALAICIATVIAAPARAAEGGAFYRVELAQPAAAGTVVAGGLAWRCNGSACNAGKSSSRDAIVCAKLVKEVGAVTSFATPKGALEGDDLARCNKG